MSRNIAVNDVLVTIALASMMHLDWHVARPAERAARALTPLREPPARPQAQ